MLMVHQKSLTRYEDKEFQDNLKTLHEWYKEGLIPTDAATNTTGFPLEGNTWFMRGKSPRTNGLRAIQFYVMLHNKI